MKSRLAVGTMSLCVALLLSGCQEEPAPTPAATASPSFTTAPAAAPAVDTTTPDSLTVMVNKQNPLQPQGYAPTDLREIEGHQLRAEAADAAQNMLQDMRADGVQVTVTSAYRSYETQVSTYDHWVQQNGQLTADRVSARPSFSEHQTGLAMDLADATGCDLQACFANTEAAQWAAQNAPDYGFVLRFPEGQENVTGYVYEPWHFRYIGPDQAQAFRSSQASTLEEFLGTGPAPDYE